MLNQEGGVDPKNTTGTTQVDRVNTTASVWLGSTLGCAQCHNHKFDPFTQKDYYRFLAFYGNSKYKIHGYGSERYAEEPELELPTPDQAARSAEIRAKMALFRSSSTPRRLRFVRPSRVGKSRCATRRSNGRCWLPSRPSPPEEQHSRCFADGSVLATGKNPEADGYTIQLKTNQNGITAVRLEVLPDESLPNGGPGRDPEGNFFLSAFDVNVSPLTSTGAPPKSTFVSMKKVVANESQSGYSADGILSKRTRPSRLGDRQRPFAGWRPAPLRRVLWPTNRLASKAARSSRFA